MISDEIRFAIGTYTRLPVPPPERLEPAVAGRGLALGPLVGTGLGLASGLPLLVTGPDLVARLLSATLVVTLAAWLTRGLHWDGLADLADGLGSRTEPAMALAIMRRSDIGPFGVLALVFTIALQVLSIAQLPAGPPALAGWVLAVALGRMAVAVACGPWSRPARAEGLGALVVGAVTPKRLAIAAGLATVTAVVQVVAGYVPAGVALVWAPLAGVVTAVALVRLAARRLGGVTGDVLGATAELATTAAMLVMALS